MRSSSRRIATAGMYGMPQYQTEEEDHRHKMGLVKTAAKEHAIAQLGGPSVKSGIFNEAFDTEKMGKPLP